MRETPRVILCPIDQSLALTSSDLVEVLRQPFVSLACYKRRFLARDSYLHTLLLLLKIHVDPFSLKQHMGSTITRNPPKNNRGFE